MKKKKIIIHRVVIAGVILIILLVGIIFGLVQGVKALKNTFATTTIINENKNHVAVVVLDPGHGGHDAGANDGELLEKNITLETCKKIEKYLSDQNIKVYFTRSEDVVLDENKKRDLQKRAEYASEVNADLFVSIHVNDFDKPNTVNGFEVYAKNDSEESEALAKDIENKVKDLSYIKSRGLGEGRSLLVLEHNEKTSALVEMGYLRSSDQDYLADDAKLDEIAKAISEGILTYINE